MDKPVFVIEAPDKHLLLSGCELLRNRGIEQNSDYENHAYFWDNKEEADKYFTKMDMKKEDGWRVVELVENEE